MPDRTPERPTDPHPSTEEHYDRIRNPGGANPPQGGRAGVAVDEHNGEPPPRPDNVETNAEAIQGEWELLARRESNEELDEYARRVAERAIPQDDAGRVLPRSQDPVEPVGSAAEENGNRKRPQE